MIEKELLANILPFIYLLASVGFILAMKWMSSPATARRGVIIGEIGMLLAVIGTLLKAEQYTMVLVALAIGTAIGAPLAYLMPMTAVPQLTALSHAFGALASALIGTAEYYRNDVHPQGFQMSALGLETLLGYLTTTASVIAFAKLQDLMPTRPLTYKGQNVVSITMLVAAVVLAVLMVVSPEHAVWAFPVFIALSLIFGVMLVIPIGGADMPTVIALLNSFAGVAAAAMGFVLDNKLLIVAGALNGAAGLILSIIMCRAMNRSFVNVLFGAFGQLQAGAQAGEQRPVHSATPEEAAAILDTAQSVIIVPGYGMAVAQAQHRVRELYDLLTKRGADVRFAIHPVAGRMPGHMNVLLAEADIPYDKLIEMEDINPEFPMADVALVIGANDVVNPLARSDQDSPIAGTPILDADRARTVMVVKRSMSPGFAGIDNDLYYMPHTLMLFGDAKTFIGNIVKELAAAHAGK
jgi:NAD(P) transhydrogenase subunit beta